MATNRITSELNQCVAVNLKSILEDESQDKSNQYLGKSPEYLGEMETSGLQDY